MKKLVNVIGRELILNFKSSLVKFTAVLSVFFTGISVVNVPVQTAQADTVDSSQVDKNTTNAVTPEIAAPVKKAKTTSAKTKKLNAIVKLAKKQVGKSYVYGATGPYAFDCSGLVQYVYRNAGKKELPRTTYSQVNVGKRVSLSHLKKGDLLFWGSASAPYHVGIYVGNGQYVHAATPSQGVRKQALSGYFYPSAAKRVL